MTDTPSKTEKSYSLPIRRPVTTAMIFLTFVVFGWKSYQELPINLMPDISYPTLTVRTEFEGAAPEDVEKLLTRPLEETLSIVSGLVEISSTSSAGLSEIVMEFTWDSDMSLAQQDVRDRLDLYDPPKEVTEKPVILRYDPTLDPVLRVAITGEDFSEIADPVERDKKRRHQLLEIRDAAEEQVKSDLEGEPGIAQVLVKGGREVEIQVLVDSDALKNIGMTLEMVSSALAQQNVNMPGGTLREGKTEHLVRTYNEYRSVEEILETPIGQTPNGTQIKLSQVAQVIRGEKDRETVVRINGQEAVELEIYKWGDSNTVQVCNTLKDMFGFERDPTVMERFKKLFEMGEGEIPEDAPPQIQAMLIAKQMQRKLTLRDRLPKFSELTLISDQSRFITAAIKEVQNTAVVGGLLALIILYFFLRQLKSTIIIGVSIPISVVATFIPMFMRDVTMNIMSLGGLALGVGMLVDNSIVVLESIFRCIEEGDGTVDAADRGTREVGGAVTASTLTTIAVFLPLAFVEGVAGQLFRDQALTVTFSLIASLLVALYLIPMIASRRTVSLSGGKEVIWVLRGFREARAAGRGRLASLGLILPYGIRDAWLWLEDNAEETFGPTIAGARRAAAAVRDVAWLGWAFKMLLIGIGAVAAILALVYIGTGFWLGQAQAASVTMIAAIVCLSLPLLALVGMVVFPVSLVVFLFVFHTGMKCFGVFWTTVLYFVSVTVMAVVWIVGKVLSAILWLPLSLFDWGFTAFREIYAVALRASLRFSLIVLLLTGALAVHAGYKALSLGRELIPPLKQGEFTIRMEAPPGTRLDDTEIRAMAIEEVVRNTPDVETVTVEVGQEKTSTEASRGENVAEFTVLLSNPERTAARQDEIIEDLRQRIREITFEDITFALPSLFSFNTAIELQIRGDDLDDLRELGKEAVTAISDVPGLKDAEMSIKPGYPEIIIELDRDLCAANNLDPEQVAQRLRTEVSGDAPTTFNQEGTKIDIRVRTDRRRLGSVEDLRNISVREGDPPLPLRAVAKISQQEGPSEIRRVDQRQVALVTANVEGRDLGSVSEAIAMRLATVKGLNDYQFGGQNRELKTSIESLQFALLLAIFLVYVVMACQFESVWQPAIVMFAVPLAFIGVIYVLAWLSIDVSIVVYIGGIILAGIVVNDAIVLVDYVNQLRARGMTKREAVVQAGRVRLRPILMTTLTTVLGLIPMATWTGEGAEIRQPMAITVMAGLSSATVLTLFIIPMVYDLFARERKTEEQESA
ncbi:MAG: hypothetical protein GY851_30645 [bacterium]|nr:hypothetical protein [bacterium]